MDTGAPIDYTVPEPAFTVSISWGQGLDVAWNGRQYLVVWPTGAGEDRALIRGTRVTTCRPSCTT